MQRVLVQVVRGRDLDDLPEVHHGDPVGDVTHDGEVVRDEEVREAELRLELLEQVHDLRLDRHVERGHRLVAHEERRVERERARKTDPLALTARELVREAIRGVRRETDDLEDLPHAGRRLAPTGDAVHPERFADRAADRMSRVERGEGILEDHLHSASQRPQLGLAQVRDVGSLEQHAPAGRLVQPEHRPTDGRLPATRLTDEPDRLAALDRQRDAVDGLDVADVAIEEDSTLDREPDTKVVQLDERRRAVLAHAASPPSCVRFHSSGAARVEARRSLPGVELLELPEAPPCSGRDGTGSVAQTGTSRAR